MQFFEVLEERRLLSAGGHPGTGGEGHGKGKVKTPPTPETVMPRNAVKVAGRNLTIQGTKGADVISVAVNPDDPTKLDVTYNGVVKTVPAGKIKRIMINAKGGDDSVTVDAGVSVRAHLMGGVGNDTLVGGSGDDKLFGGAGENQMTGGAGKDRFVARSASEVLDLDEAQGDSGEFEEDEEEAGTGGDVAGDGSG